MSLFQRCFFHSSVKLLQLNMKKKESQGIFKILLPFFMCVSLLSRYCYQCSQSNFAIG